MRKDSSGYRLSNVPDNSSRAISCPSHRIYCLSCLPSSMEEYTRNIHLQTNKFIIYSRKNKKNYTDVDPLSIIEALAVFS